ncbi:MAG: hypothetical protein ACKOCH_21960, partial [Bacteroidota bacterium]
FTVTLFNKSAFTPLPQEYLTIFDKLNLTPPQKRILVAGMDNEELSPFDIYKALNTNDRNTYDREVTYLRNTGILTQIRTNIQAKTLAFKLRKDKQKIPRFKVVFPK